MASEDNSAIMSGEFSGGLIIAGRGRSLAEVVDCYRRGTNEPLCPECVSDEGLSWSGRQVGERGLDLVVKLDKPQFVARVVLRQAVRREAGVSESVSGAQASSVRPVGQAIEAAEMQVTHGIGAALVFARPDAGSEPRLVAKQAASCQGVLPDAIVLDLAVEATEVALSLESFRRDISITALEVWGGDPDAPRIYPQPRQYRKLPGAPLVLGDEVPIRVASGPSADLALAASVLQERLAALGKRSVILNEDAAETPAVVLSVYSAACSRPVAEGYRLSVTADGAVLTAADRRGLLYGIEALAQLVEGAGPVGVQACEVEDAPKMAFRGVHLYMPSRKNLPFFRRLIRHLLVPMRYNTLFLEVGAGMAYDRHPEINDAWVRDKQEADRGLHNGSPHIEVADGGYLSKAEVRELVAYAEEHGIEVIPEIQSLSHVEFLTMAHPEIAENPAERHPDCYCPLNERSYEILFDLIDEIVEVFRPRRYVHMGHDEAYTMCVCDKCKDVPKAKLFAQDVSRIYQYLRTKGLGMMIWDDMVNTTRDFACPDALDLIPKDIVLLNFVWYDRMDVDTEDVLLDHGFPVMIGNFYSSHFPRFATREGKAGLVGAEVSTWCLAAEADYGRVGKLYDFMFSANMMWSPHYRDELRRLYDRRISALLPAIRDALSGSVYPSRRPGSVFAPLDLAEAAQAPRRDCTGAQGGYDLTNLPQGERTLGGVPMLVGPKVVLVAGPSIRGVRASGQAAIPIGRRCDSIVLLQACVQPGTPSPYNGRAQPIAQYDLVYADGTRAKTTIEYGGQLAEWSRPHGEPLRHGHWRHSGYVATYPALPFWQGKTPGGEDVTLYGYEWVNPHPEREVAYLEVSSPPESGDAALILVAATVVQAMGARP